MINYDKICDRMLSKCCVALPLKQLIICLKSTGIIQRYNPGPVVPLGWEISQSLAGSQKLRGAELRVASCFATDTFYDSMMELSEGDFNRDYSLQWPVYMV